MRCESGAEFTAPAVIIATGTVERLLNIPGEQEMIGRGISFCAVCDAAFYRNKPVIIVGAGNAAFEESLYLAEFASKVTILARRDVISAEQITQEKVAANPKIEVLTWRVPQEVIIENNRVAGLKVLNKQTGATETMLARGVFPISARTLLQSSAVIWVLPMTRVILLCTAICQLHFLVCMAPVTCATRCCVRL